MQHSWHVDEREYRRHEARRGRRHAYDELDPGRTALVVVDMVAFFVSENAYARGVVPAIRELAMGLRSAGGTVAWVVPDGSPETARPDFYGSSVATAYGVAGGGGPIEHRLWPEFEVDVADLLVEKSGPSAFFPGRSELPAALSERDIDTVLIAGTVAEVCCESSARDAVSQGYRLVFVADANASGRDEDLNATLRTIYRSFGDVRPVAEILEMLG